MKRGPFDISGGTLSPASADAVAARQMAVHAKAVARRRWIDLIGFAVLVRLIRAPSVTGFDACMQTLRDVERRQHGSLLTGRQIRSVLARQRQAAVDPAEVLVVGVAGRIRPKAVTAIGPGNAVPA